MKKLFLLLTALVLSLTAKAQKEYGLTSPDGRIDVLITTSEEQIGYYLWYDGAYRNTELFGGFTELCRIQDGKEVRKLSVRKVTRREIDETVPSLFYRQTSMRNHCNELTLHMKEGLSLVFRAYNEGVAYRYQWEGKPGKVKEEPTTFVFSSLWPVTAPYTMQYDSNDHSMQWTTSFENQYTTVTFHELDTKRLCFLPLLVHGPDNLKICITESALIDYPGMYIRNLGEGVLREEHAPLPRRVEQGGWGNLQLVVKEREGYIAEMDRSKVFPWRIMMIGSDTEIAENNMSYLLAEKSRVEDISWIKPGKSAWEWWNSWNISGVPFTAGINNDTYKHYIDFAARYGLQYIVMDEGWSVGGEADLFQVVPELDLPMLVDYARERGVGIILWAGYYAFDRDMERVCQHYSDMGIKGFKIDFMNRDDQLAVDFFRRTAEVCARHHLVVDFHGAFKPAGLNRTYPNVLNFEGVFGLEQMRWAWLEWDQMRYDCQIPFIRQVAGPMDYTPGAMLNGTRNTYRPNGMEPMSQGTRCHQLALYVVLDQPLAMLCDSPTNYEREPDYTSFLAKIPTVWDETRVLMGEVGEYIVTARRKGDTWYIGGITNWTPRDIKLDISSLGIYNPTIEIYTDGANAHRKGSDYSRGIVTFQLAQIHLAPGGGFVAKVTAE